MSRERPDPGHPSAALVLIALLVLALNLRAAITVVPPLLGRLSNDLGMSVGAAAVLSSLPGIAFALSGLVAPALLRRWSVDRLLVTLTALVAISQLARPWAPGPTPFVAASAITLLTMGLANVLLPVVVKTWFPDRIGPVTSLFTSALAVGTALPALIAVPLADLADGASWRWPGWYVSLQLWGVLALVPLTLWALVVRRSATPPATQASGPEPTTAPTERLALHRSPVAWGVMLVFGMTSLTFYSLAAWLPSRLADAGLSEGVGGVQLAIVAGLGLPVAMVVPALVARVGRTTPFVLAFAVLLVVGELGLLLAPATMTSLWSVTAGVGMGGFPMAMAMISLRSDTPVGAGMLAGFAQGLGYVCGALGPVVVGGLHALTGGWTLPIAFLLATTPLLVLGGWLVRHPRTVEQDLADRRTARARGAKTAGRRRIR